MMQYGHQEIWETLNNETKYQTTRSNLIANYVSADDLALVDVIGYLWV